MEQAHEEAAAQHAQDISTLQLQHEGHAADLVRQLDDARAAAAAAEQCMAVQAQHASARADGLAAQLEVASLAESDRLAALQQSLEESACSRADLEHQLAEAVGSVVALKEARSAQEDAKAVLQQSLSEYRGTSAALQHSLEEAESSRAALEQEIAQGLAYAAGLEKHLHLKQQQAAEAEAAALAQAAEISSLKTNLDAVLDER